MCDYCEHSKIFGRRSTHVDGGGKAVVFGSINRSKDGNSCYIRVRRAPGKDDKPDDIFTISLRYCPFCGEKLVGDPIFPEITHESTMEMLNHKAIAPKMKFWTKEEGRYVGIDNTAGDFKNEGFLDQRRMPGVVGRGKYCREKFSSSYGIRLKQRRSTMDILKKIWNTSVTVGQVIVTAVIGLIIGLVVWVLVGLFRPSKD